MKADWVLLEDNSSNDGIAFIFTNPIETIIANNIDEIPNALLKLENFAKNGKYLVGYASYEFGLCFEEKTKKFSQNLRYPLLFFYVFDEPKTTKSKIITRFLKIKNKNNGFFISKPQYSIDFNEYEKRFENIHKNIKSGDIYQANLTFKAFYDFWGNSLCLYEKLRLQQKVKYSAYFNIGDLKILSLSPELFFKTNDEYIITHPMKGTIKRGIDNKTDIENYNSLYNDEKQRAENLMITDLMRNDLSKISQSGSVKVPNLFAIEKFSTLFQMISKISAKLKNNINSFDILKNLSPAGSITGCPKIRAEELIFENEKTSRDIYCGSIGLIKPNGDATFNVAIRTPILNNNKIELGIGSGLVYDSIAKLEYEECKLKAKFLNEIIEEFALIETILWQRNIGFSNLSLHFNRIKQAADFFNFNFIQQKIESELKLISQNIGKNTKWQKARIRILLNEKNHKIEFYDLPDSKEIWKITLSKNALNSQNPWLYYKTTNRQIYDIDFKNYNEIGFDEIIYCNENNEITEGSRTNIFIDNGDGILLTPPIKCGLLNGILRQKLINDGKAIEKILHLEDMFAAQNIYVGNSIRGLKKAIYII